MVIFLESPWPILLIGIAVEAVLAVMLLRTGQGRLLWAMLGMAAVVLLGLAVERLVVTDREAVGKHARCVRGGGQSQRHQPPVGVHFAHGASGSRRSPIRARPVRSPEGRPYRPGDHDQPFDQSADGQGQVPRDRRRPGPQGRVPLPRVCRDRDGGVAAGGRPLAGVRLPARKPGPAALTHAPARGTEEVFGARFSIAAKASTENLLRPLGPSRERIPIFQNSP